MLRILFMKRPNPYATENPTSRPVSSAPQRLSQGESSISRSNGMPPFLHTNISLFERFPTEVLSNILNFLSLKNLLIFRMLSKQACNFVTSCSSNQASLANKAVIPFNYSLLKLQTNQEITKKFEFSIKYTPVRVIFSLQELQELISVKEIQILYKQIFHNFLTTEDSKSMFDSIPDDKLKILLNIKNLEDFFSFVKKLPSNELYLKFFTKIDAINFTSVEINHENINIFNQILDQFSQNPTLVSQIRSLAFGTIHQHTDLVIPPAVFNQLSSLTFNYLCSQASITLPILSNLEYLSFEKIYYQSTLNFPEVFDSLKSLFFEDIARNMHLNITSSCKKLKTISIGNLKGNSKVILSKNLPSLKNLTVRNIGEYSSIVLTAILPNLTYLSIESLKEAHSLTLTPEFFPKLEHLYFHDIEENVTLTLSNPFPELKELHFNNLCPNATVNISSHCPKLELFSIQDIEDEAWLRLEDPFTFKKLSVKSIAHDSSFQLNNSCTNLTDIFFAELENTNDHLLPSSLPNLKTATFGNLFNTLTLPNQFCDLNEFHFIRIETCSKLIIPPSFHKLETLYFGFIASIFTKNIQSKTSDSISTEIEFIPYDNSVDPNAISDILSNIYRMPLIENRVVIAIPSTLIQPQKLTLGAVNSNTTFQLSTFIKYLDIDLIDDNLTITLENPPTQFLLRIQNIGNNVIFEIPPIFFGTIQFIGLIGKNVHVKYNGSLFPIPAIEIIDNSSFPELSFK